MQAYVFRDEDRRIVGLISAFLHVWEGRRQLTLLGSGVSDYLDPPISLSHREQVINNLADNLTKSSAWDVTDWQDLSFDTPLTVLGPVSRLRVQSHSDLPCSEIPINRSFPEFWAERPSGLRRNVRRYREKAEQIAPIEFTVTPTYDENCLAALIRLHGERWREQGELGMIAANRSSHFLRDVTQTFSSLQMLRFFSLRFQGEISAVILAFAYRNVLYGYLSAFDPANAALGFGRTLLYEALHHAFGERYAGWNFLRGSEPYKAEWGAREILKTRLIIERQ